jgi:mRNA-degrading endonuclease RelE of RelBE toxin-antitoxin system
LARETFEERKGVFWSAALFRRTPRLLCKAERLENWPAVSGAKPLRGALAGYYRLRTGDYRLQFHVAGETVLVEKIGHRDGFYED